MLILLLHHVAIMLILIPINKGWNMQNATTTLSALARQTAAIEVFTAALRDMDKLDALTALETAINAIDAESEADITLELDAAIDALGAAYVAVSGRGRNGLALDTGRLSGRSTGRCRWGVMWRERHDRRLSRFEGLPARQAFDLGRALPGLPRETAQSQREDIGAGSDLQGAQAFLPRSPPRAHRGRVRRSHGSAWMGRAV